MRFIRTSQSGGGATASCVGKFDSPFANLAMIANMVRLSWIITADAMVSPTGSAFAYTAGTSRHVFGMAKGGFLPGYFGVINKRFGDFTRALALNFVIVLLFLFPLKSWTAIVAIVGAIVIYCEDNRKAIEELTLEELQQISPHIEGDLYAFIDYQNILNKGIKVGLLR
ncbi:hypothetical protein [Brevibacillus agri]|uniref:hypothetical protein n=1 Tax=Brevibacillus agri TaxID=51101 RepID=UPI003D1DB931